MEMNNSYSKPLITTIIPTYRRPKMLRRAIKSVLNQTYPHFQVCVYDNASGDETAEVVSEFAKKDPRVKYHCHPENIGAIKNFNYGMKQVNTPFFSFLSDDDILLPEFYQTALEGFKKHPEAIFSSTLTLIAYNKTDIRDTISSNWKDGFYQPPEGLLAMLKNGHPTWTGILFRKGVIEKIGLINEKVNIISDLDFQFRIASHFPFVISLNAGAIFMAHIESTWVQADIENIIKDYYKIINNLIEDKHIPIDVRRYVKNVLEKRVEKISFSRGIISILQNNYGDTEKIIKVLSYNYHLKKRAFIISIIAKTCKYFPPIKYFFVLLSKSCKFFARTYRKKKYQNLHERYKNILTFER